MALTKICDGCGGKFEGKSYPVYNENNVKQHGVIYCIDCAYGDKELWTKIVKNGKIRKSE